MAYFFKYTLHTKGGVIIGSVDVLARDGEHTTIKLDAPALISEIHIMISGSSDEERDDAPRSIDVDEALTVLTDFVHEHTREED